MNRRLKGTIFASIGVLMYIFSFSNFNLFNSDQGINLISCANIPVFCIFPATGMVNLIVIMSIALIGTILLFYGIFFIATPNKIKEDDSNKLRF